MKLSSFLLTITSVFIFTSTAPVFAYETGDIILRLGAAQVDPDSDSSNLKGPVAPLVAPAPNGVEVNEDTQLGITVTYMLNEKLGVELLAATPFGHGIHGTGTLNNLKIASTRHLPPTLNLQYYPANGGEKFSPYFGVGINYTVFFEDEASATLEAVGLSLWTVVNDVKLTNSQGFPFRRVRILIWVVTGLPILPYGNWLLILRPGFTLISNGWSPLT